MEAIIDYLNKKKKFISTMESCTGGYIASSITNISGSSMVFQFGAVTYSNSFKINLGVKKDIIDKYSVYSIECAKEMSRAISFYTNSDYGVGITGKINLPDPNNMYGDNSTIYLSIYDKEKNIYYEKVIKSLKRERIENKEFIKNEFVALFKEMIIKE